jgi:hypothetical protein
MYFAKPGPENTGETVAIAVREAQKRNISHIAAASNTGKTIELLIREAEQAGYTGRLVCVTHAYGFREGGTNEMAEETRRSLEARGVRVYTASHILSGAERGISRRFQGVYPVEIIAHSLRMLGAGTKVCVEIAVMALDGGLLPWKTPVIAAGGTGGGADTAVLLTPAHAAAVFDTKIHEILCKPGLPLS